MAMWLVMGGLMMVAIGFVAWPLYRGSGKLSGMLAAVIVTVVTLSAGLYYQLGRPDVPSGRTVEPDPQSMVASLAARLESDPNDVEGWVMLARSYEVLQQYDKAANAYEKILELNPRHPMALFYGGYIAAGRGELNLAADRWEALLREGAPAEVRDTLQQQIAAWRGETPPENAAAEQQAAVVTLDVSLGERARAALTGDATVFVIARDPAQPSPPIAVARRRLSELPAEIALSDRDAMVPGRLLSAFDQLELVVRVSRSGAPAAAPGDWFASANVVPSSTPVVELVIDEQVE